MRAKTLGVLATFAFQTLVQIWGVWNNVSIIMKNALNLHVP